MQRHKNQPTTSQYGRPFGPTTVFTDTSRRKLPPWQANGASTSKATFIVIITVVVVAFIIVPKQISHCQFSPVQPSSIVVRPYEQPHRPVVIVPGSESRYHQAHRVDQVILPSEHYSGNISQDLDTSSYVIDNKRFIEAVSSRCFATTILEDPDSVEPTFVIVKPNSEIRLNATASPDQLLWAGIEPKKRTIIIIHGFTQSYPETKWLRRIRALFEIHSLVKKQNLIIMDWGKASHGSYSQVAALVSGMGSFLANFLGKLIDLGQDRMSIHIIGHSLGAHLAGFAGKRLRPRIGRITALDPAGPCFGKLFSNSANDRLSADDAYEVDVYHYDDDFLGLPGQIGQFDIYVNGGSSQPGATDNVNSMVQALVTMVFRRNRVLSESHTRSTEVPSCQLSSTGCQQIAYECRDWPAFVAGECAKCDDHNNQCFMMGFDFQYANRDPMPLRTSFPGKRLYIATSSNEHYCLQHYQILIKFEPQPELTKQAKRSRWRLVLELINERNERVTLSVTNQMAPHVFSYLLLSEHTPVRFRSASLQVRASDNSIVPLRGPQTGASFAPVYNKQVPVFQVNQIEVNFMSNVDPNVRRALSSRLCPTSALVGAPIWFTANMRNALEAASNSIADSSPQSIETDSLSFEECLIVP